MDPDTETKTLNNFVAYRNHIYYSARSFWKQVELEWEGWLRKENLSISQYIILDLLMNSDELTVSEISEIGAMHISTALNFCKRLIIDGYVTSKKKSPDRRATYMTITDKGKNKLEKVESIWNKSRSELSMKADQIEKLLGEKPTLQELKTLSRRVEKTIAWRKLL